MDHLLPLGQGAGGKSGEESDELKMACLMGLVSVLAAVPEVQRISPLHASELKNAVAGAIVQSGNIAEKPLTDAGLDGAGEIIQVSDTSLCLVCSWYSELQPPESITVSAVRKLVKSIFLLNACQNVDN